MKNMKRITRCIVALVALIGGQQINAYHQKGNNHLVPVKVRNDIKTIGRIYVSVKSEHHATKLTRIWGIAQVKKLRFSLDSMNTICAYETKKHPKTRYIYKLELAQDGTNHRVKLHDNELEYTYKAPNGLDQTIRIPGDRQERIDDGSGMKAHWQSLQK